MDLSSILSKPASEIEAPKPLPAGLYMAQVEKIGEVREVGQNKTPGIDFTYKLLQPLDVEIPPGVDFPRSIRKTHFLSENSLFRFKQFLEDTLKIDGSGRTLGDMLPEANGRIFRVEIVEQMYTPKNGEPTMINNVGKEFAAE